MPRETLILTQDIAADQLLDSHPKVGSNLRKIVDLKILDVFPVLSVAMPGGTSTTRLDAALSAKSPAVGAGLGVMTSRKHQVFVGGTDHAIVDGTTTEINGDLAHTAAITFQIDMTAGLNTGLTVGNPGDVQIGDMVQIATPVPYISTVTNIVPSGMDYLITFSNNFVTGASGIYTMTRMSRWLFTFKDSTNAPYNVPAGTVDLGVLQRVLLGDVDELALVGMHPEFAPDVAGGGGGGGTITGGGTAGFLTKFTAATAIGDSVIQEAGGNIGIGVAPGAFRLNVDGDGRFDGTLITTGVIVAGGVAPIGGELLRVVGDARVEGKLTVTGAIDPTSILLSGGTALYYESEDGSTAPLAGAATGRLRYNNTTGRWEQSAQGGAYVRIQTPATDIYGATRIVDPSGNGTDLTIAAAITNLPATGGLIFVKQGIYTETATLVLPGAKNVVIKGAGKGATVINLTTAAIPLFQIGAAATGKYAFSDFTATGDGATAQPFIDLASAVDVVVENVDVDDFRDIVDDAAGAEVIFRDCEFSMPSDAGCSFWRGTGPAGTLVWIYTEATLSTAATSAISGNPDWQVTDSYIGGPGASFYAVGQIIWQTFRLDSAEVTVASASSRINECYFNNAGIIFNGTGNVVGDSVFFSGSPATFLSLQFGGANNVVSGNTFNGGSTTAIDILAAATETVISGNRFFPTFFTCVKNAASNCAMSGNSGMQVIESGAANNNRYTGNREFAGSVILGADCVVEGVRRKDVTGVATPDVLVTQFTHQNAKGLEGSGSIKNTGGSNSLTIRRTATDAYGVTDFQEDPVLPGASAVWSTGTPLGTAIPPFVSFVVAVKSTTPGLPTTFDLRHISSGAY